jgi:hypothetical protein
VELRARVPLLISGTRRPAALAVLLALSGAATAKVYLSQEEALALAFGKDARVERRSAFLTTAEVARVKSDSGGPPPSPLVVSYAGAAGTAYFDTHVVRTEKETLLVLVAPDGKLARIEVLSFSEPEEYLPRPAWYAQFAGKPLDAELSIKRGIRPVSGATLTANATIEAARRVLAIDAVLRARAAPKAP